MKKIILKTLKIHNFKGIADMEIRFSPECTNIYGSNATGKTTIADAFFWLLFDKDSAGRSDFNIKPLGTDGSVAEHSATTMVEGTIEVDGVETVYKKTLRERWGRRRGSDNLVFDGNETERFINDLPLKKYEYDAKITEIADENVFRAVTSTSYFCKTLSNTERRKLLFDMTGTVTDAELMTADDRFAGLLPLLAKLGSIDNIKTAKTRERKIFNEKRANIPIRVDELAHQAQTLAGIDFEEIEHRKAAAESAAEKAKEKVASIKNFSYPNELVKEIEQTELELKKLELDNREYRSSQSANQKDISILLSAARAEEANVIAVKGIISEIEASTKQLREDFKNISSARIKTEEACPTCGRAWDAEHTEKAMQKLREERGRRLDEINQKGMKLKAQLAEYEEKAADAQKRLDAIKADIDAASDVPPVQDMPGYSGRRAELQTKIAELKNQKLRHQSEFEAMLKEAESELNACIFESMRLSEELSKRGIIDECERRIGELNEQAVEIASEIENVDIVLNNIDEFTRYKVSVIEDSINSLFKYVRFKLFDEQINGALSECCEAVVGGVPFGDLNTAAQINAGLDIVNAVSAYYGVAAPVFIDNAESIVKILDIEPQTIRLTVSEKDEKLRVEI